MGESLDAYPMRRQGELYFIFNCKAVASPAATQLRISPSIVVITNGVVVQGLEKSVHDDSMTRR